MPPSVTTKAGTPSFATQTPFQSPTKAPRARAARIVTIAGMVPQVSSRAMTVVQRPRNEPTDRSISPWAMTTSMPSATIAVMELWRIRLTRLRSLRKILSVMIKKNSQTMAIASISPSVDRDCNRKRRLTLCAGAVVMILVGLDNS